MIPIATPERVFDAADALHESGVAPTVAAVRDEIGGGSAATIAPLLAKWREARAKADALPPVPEPPKAHRQLWEAAYRQASAAWDAERRMRDEALGTLRAELAERDAAVAEIAEEARVAREAREDAEARVAEATARVVALTAQLERTQERLREAEEARREREAQVRKVIAEEIRAALEANAAASRTPAPRAEGEEDGLELH